MPNMLVSVLISIGRRRRLTACSTASRRGAPSRSAARVWYTNKIALLTTRPSKIINPIMVSISMGWKVTWLTSRSATTPPTVASGRANSTSRLSRKDRNRALISRYKIAMANRKLPPILVSATSSLSAVPLYRMAPSSGSNRSISGSTFCLKVSKASSSAILAGGVICSVTVRRRSSRRI